MRTESQTFADWQRLVDQSSDHCESDDNVARLEWIAEQAGMETTGFVLDWSGDCVSYVNVGDPYTLTACLRNGELSVACYADFIEDDEAEAATEGYFRSAYSGEFFSPAEFWSELSQSDRTAFLRRDDRWKAFSFADLRALVSGESCDGIRTGDILDWEANR